MSTELTRVVMYEKDKETCLATYLDPKKADEHISRLRKADNDGQYHARSFHPSTYYADLGTLWSVHFYPYGCGDDSHPSWRAYETDPPPDSKHYNIVTRDSEFNALRMEIEVSLNWPYVEAENELEAICICRRLFVTAMMTNDRGPYDD